MLCSFSFPKDPPGECVNAHLVVFHPDLLQGVEVVRNLPGRDGEDDASINDQSPGEHVDSELVHELVKALTGLHLEASQHLLRHGHFFACCLSAS